MTKNNIDKIKELIKELLIQIGEDPQREGIINTPERVAKAWQFLAKGYNQDLDSLINNVNILAIFNAAVSSSNSENDKSIVTCVGEPSAKDLTPSGV